METAEKNKIIASWRADKNACYQMLIKDSYWYRNSEYTTLWKCLRRGLTIEQAFKYLETGKFPLPKYIRVKKTKNSYVVKVYLTILPTVYGGDSNFYAGTKAEAWKFAYAFYKKRILDKDVDRSIAIKKTFK